jgi:hypothetical protein
MWDLRDELELVKNPYRLCAGAQKPEIMREEMGRAFWVPPSTGQRILEERARRKPNV